MKPAKAYAYQIFSLLQSHYPHAKMILTWENNFELLVAIMLSAQCTDKKVNEVTAKLFPKYRKIWDNSYKYYNDYKSYKNISQGEIEEIINFAEIPLNELEQDIKPTGFYHNKAKHIQATARVVLEKYKGVLPKTIAHLTSLPGVGRKTANVFLGNAYHMYEGIAVDTHVQKQAKKLGLTKLTNPDKIEKDLMQLFDKKDWFTLTYLLIAHGRNKRRRKDVRIVCGNSGCVLCADK